METCFADPSCTNPLDPSDDLPSIGYYRGGCGCAASDTTPLGGLGLLLLGGLALLRRRRG